MAATCVITIAYEINGETGFLSNASEREFCSLEEPGSGHGEISQLKYFTWLKTIM